jgi:hypothetical protein
VTITDKFLAVLNAAPRLEGEPARIARMVDRGLEQKWMQGQVTLRGGGTFAGIMTVDKFENGNGEVGGPLVRILTPQPNGKDTLIVDQHFALDELIFFATLLEVPVIKTVPANAQIIFTP